MICQKDIHKSDGFEAKRTVLYERIDTHAFMCVCTPRGTLPTRTRKGEDILLLLTNESR